MIDGYEKHTCNECETMFTSNEELQQHHAIDHGLIIENSIEWTDVKPEDKIEETDNGFTSDGKKITFSDEDKSIAESYLAETANLQRVMVASEQRLKLARDEINASEAETNAFYEQFLGESNGQDFSSGAGTINPLDTPKFKYSKNNKLADTINTKGYNPNPNAGLYDNKEFKEGGDHLEDPLAKEDFEVSFYGKESKANEVPYSDRDKNEWIWTCPKCSQQVDYVKNKRFPIDHLRSHGLSDENIEQILTLDFNSSWKMNDFLNESKASEFGDYEVKCDTCDGKGYELEWSGSEQEYFEDPCDACGGKGTNTWTSTVDKSDESLKADWDDSDYEEKYAWLKDLGVEDAFKYANLTLYELPEAIWKVVNEDYVQGFKQMTGESYKPDQKDTVETSEEKIISRKLDNVPVGQIARELVLWDNMSEDEAEKMVSETEPSDDDMSAKSLFNKKYSELNENELAEMELYDV